MYIEYDYSKYENILIEMLKASWRDPDELEIGVDISDLPEVKITFEGYGDLDEENIDNNVSPNQQQTHSTQCNALTKKGTRCRKMTKNKNGKCNLHE